MKTKLTRVYSKRQRIPKFLNIKPNDHLLQEKQKNYQNEHESLQYETTNVNVQLQKMNNKYHDVKVYSYIQKIKEV